MRFDAAVKLVRGGRSFLVSCHRRPDGDALGAALGLAAGLRTLGKRATVYHPEPPPFSLEFLVRPGDVVATLPSDARFDATFVTDTAVRALLPDPFPGPAVTGPLVVLDHHVASEDFGELVLRDCDACATGVVVVQLLEALGVSEIPPDAAIPLYTSIVADTGGFRFPSTSADTLRLGARLIEAGAEPWTVAYNLFEGWPHARVGLLRDVLATLDISMGGQLAALRVTREMLERNGATDDMVDGLVEYGRRVRGVEITALLWERPPRGGRPVTKVSFRSTRDADVAALATALGGGGHRVAAAAELDCTIDEAAARVRAKVAKALAWES